MANKALKNSPLKLLIINGSFRECSLSETFAHLFANIALSAFDVHHIGVRELNLPNFDYGVSNHPQAQYFRSSIYEADGIIVISPEYHGCVSGALKNALDFISNELTNKPVGVLATAGSQKSGTNTLNTLRTICRSLRSHVLIEQASLSKEELTEDKKLNQKIQERCVSMVREMQEVIYFKQLTKVEEDTRQFALV